MKPGFPPVKARRHLKEAAHHRRAEAAYKKFWGVE